MAVPPPARREALHPAGGGAFFCAPGREHRLGIPSVLGTLGPETPAPPETPETPMGTLDEKPCPATITNPETRKIRHRETATGKLPLENCPSKPVPSENLSPPKIALHAASSKV